MPHVCRLLEIILRAAGLDTEIKHRDQKGEHLVMFHFSFNLIMVKKNAQFPLPATVCFNFSLFTTQQPQDAALHM